MARAVLETTAELRTELDRWRRLVDNLPALVAFWDSDLRNVLANRAYLEWFGFTPEQMRGLHISEVLGERLYQLNLPYITGALAGDEQHFERTLVSPTGQTRHSQADYIPEIVDGRVIGFYVLVSDITAKVDAQRELDEAQALTHVGSFTLKPSTQEISWSKEMYRIAGKDPATYAPSIDSWLSMIHPDDLARVQQVREQAQRGREYEIAYRFIRNGEVRHVHSTTRAVLDERGEVVLLRGTLQDETATLRTNVELETANSLLSDMIGMLGHDLRQPVTVVRGYLDHLVDDWDLLDEAARRDRLRTALRAAERMDSLLQDMLTLVNLDTATLVTRPEELDVRELVDDVLERAPGDLVVRVAGGVSAVRSDAVHGRQMLSNLLSNARRYGEPPVVLDVRGEDDRVVFSIRDRGAGVPEDFVPLLFERFTRAGSGRAATTSGSGFGLYIVRQLARANGGDVTYRPASPHGAEFRLSLPRGGP